MKFIFLFLFVPIAAATQKIKSSAADPVTKQWRVESAAVTLKSAADLKMDAALRSSGTSFTLQISGSGTGANTVIAGDEIIFLLENDSTVTATSPVVQSFERGRNSNTYRHDYELTADDLETLSRHNLQALRKYSTEGYDDIYLDKQNAGKLKELSVAFLDELVKNAVIRPRTPLVPPGFPGGKDVMLSFLNRNVKPLSGLQAGERKFALVQFAVTSDGRVSDLQIKQSAGTAYDEELLRILGRMPKWKPAMDDGQAVATVVTQPVTFMRTDGKVAVRF